MSQGRRRSRQRGRSSSKRDQKSKPELKIDRKDFWGNPEALPEPSEPHPQPGDVNALVQSLGRIPLTGHETAAQHWLTLVYERSAVLAGALAAASSLEQDNG